MGTPRSEDGWESKRGETTQQQKRGSVKVSVAENRPTLVSLIKCETYVLAWSVAYLNNLISGSFKHHLPPIYLVKFCKPKSAIGYIIAGRIFQIFSVSLNGYFKDTFAASLFWKFTAVKFVILSFSLAYHFKLKVSHWKNQTKW